MKIWKMYNIKAILYITKFSHFRMYNINFNYIMIFIKLILI